MNPLTPWQNSLWCFEPGSLQRAAHYVATYRPCPTREQIRARHREIMAAARKPADVDTMAALLTEMHAGCPAVIQGRGINEAGEVKAEASKSIRAVKGKKVAVIPIHGPIQQHMTSELDKAGGTATDFVSAAFDQCLANPAVGAVVFHCDSPGGAVYGVQELADKIYAARDQKPSYSIADSESCSASFWLSSAAGMSICTPGGSVGSVGVYVMHVDESVALEQEGVKVTMVNAGKYKTEFAPYAELSDDAKAEMQDRVDAIYDKFLSSLKRNRDTSMENVRSNYGQGRVVSAEKALAAGMVDRVMSFEALINKLTGGDSVAASSNTGPRGASATALRLRHEQRKRVWAG